jgi:hypothetical protein
MKNRGDTSAVSKGPDRDHVLLAAFLEATSRIDRRALQRSVSLIEAPKEAPRAVNLEANPPSLEASPTSLELNPALLAVEPTSLEAQLIPTAPKADVASFIFRRANLVRA